MVDFTDCIEELNSYKGSEKKKTLRYEGKKYLVKFPDPIREKNKNVSYINNAFSEYIGSNIFKIVGFETQNTILGVYRYKGQEKIVCGCEDFTTDDRILYEFESLALSAVPNKKIETELKDIIEVIEEIKIIKPDEIKEKFWDMFIIDGLIGNPDRHNGNWGIVLNAKTNNIEFSPIYDCGSCLNPMLEDKQIGKISDSELKNLAINCYSCIKEDGKKINYMTYIKTMNNEECNNAVKRIFKKIDLKRITDFIQKTEYMSKIRKEFYEKIITLRYEILEQVYKNSRK